MFVENLVNIKRDTDDSLVFSDTDIESAAKMLKTGKAFCNDKFMPECIKFAPFRLFVMLSPFFSTCLKHECLSTGMLNPLQTNWCFFCS